MVHFNLSLSGCSMGSLETCTHIISRPKPIYSFPLLKLIIIIFYYYYLGIGVGFEQPIRYTKFQQVPDIVTGSKQPIKYKILPVLGRYCKGLQTVHPHKTPTRISNAGSFVHMKGHVMLRIMMK